LTGGIGLLDMRAQWRNEGAMAAGSAFGPRRKTWRDIDLVVDLADEPLTLRWWRGAATLSALCALVAFLAPAPFEALPAMPANRIEAPEAEQFREIAISTLASGSETGVRMDASALVEPLAAAPDRPFIELFARLGSGDSVAQLLSRSDVGYADAGEDARVVSPTAA